MSRRTKIIILAVVIVAVLAFIVWLIFRRTSNVSPPTDATPVSDAQAISGIPPAPLSSVAPSRASEGAQLPRAGIEAFARSFVERYGSYSNQSNFENIENLYPFMTARMQASAKAFVAGEQAKRNGVVLYTGVTTRALSTRISSQSAAGALVRIKAQRTESATGIKDPRVYYQDIEIVLKSQGGEWKVDEAEWK